MGDPLIPDMETEATVKPVDKSTYVAIGGPRGALIGGGEVYMSHNRRQAVKDRANGDKPTSYFTCDANGSQGQQSVPYRAIAAGLTHGVIPVAHVATRYANAGLLRAFVGHLIENHAEALAEVLVDFADEIGESCKLTLALDTGDGGTPEGETPEMEG